MAAGRRTRTQARGGGRRAWNAGEASQSGEWGSRVEEDSSADKKNDVTFGGLAMDDDGWRPDPKAFDAFERLRNEAKFGTGLLAAQRPGRGSPGPAANRGPKGGLLGDLRQFGHEPCLFPAAAGRNGLPCAPELPAFFADGVHGGLTDEAFESLESFEQKQHPPTRHAAAPPPPNACARLQESLSLLGRKALFPEPPPPLAQEMPISRFPEPPGVRRCSPEPQWPTVFSTGAALDAGVLEEKLRREARRLAEATRGTLASGPPPCVGPRREAECLPSRGASHGLVVSAALFEDNHRPSARQVPADAFRAAAASEEKDGRPSVEEAFPEEAFRSAPLRGSGEPKASSQRPRVGEASSLSAPTPRPPTDLPSPALLEGVGLGGSFGEDGLFLARTAEAAKASREARRGSGRSGGGMASGRQEASVFSRASGGRGAAKKEVLATRPQQQTTRGLASQQGRRSEDGGAAPGAASSATASTVSSVAQQASPFPPPLFPVTAALKAKIIREKLPDARRWFWPTKPQPSGNRDGGPGKDSLITSQDLEYILRLQLTQMAKRPEIQKYTGKWNFRFLNKTSQESPAALFSAAELEDALRTRLEERGFLAGKPPTALGLTRPSLEGVIVANSAIHRLLLGSLSEEEADSWMRQEERGRSGASSAEALEDVAELSAAAESDGGGCTDSGEGGAQPNPKQALERKRFGRTGYSSIRHPRNMIRIEKETASPAEEAAEDGAVETNSGGAKATAAAVTPQSQIKNAPLVRLVGPLLFDCWLEGAPLFLSAACNARLMIYAKLRETLQIALGGPGIGDLRRRLFLCALVEDCKALLLDALDIRRELEEGTAGHVAARMRQEAQQEHLATEAAELLSLRRFSKSLPVQYSMLLDFHAPASSSRPPCEYPLLLRHFDLLQQQTQRDEGGVAAPRVGLEALPADLRLQVEEGRRCTRAVLSSVVGRAKGVALLIQLLPLLQDAPTACLIQGLLGGDTVLRLCRAADAQLDEAASSRALFDEVVEGLMASVAFAPRRRSLWGTLLLPAENLLAEVWNTKAAFPCEGKEEKKEATTAKTAAPFSEDTRLARLSGALLALVIHSIAKLCRTAGPLHGAVACAFAEQFSWELGRRRAREILATKTGLCLLTVLTAFLPSGASPTTALQAEGARSFLGCVTEALIGETGGREGDPEKTPRAAGADFTVEGLGAQRPLLDALLEQARASPQWAAAVTTKATAILGEVRAKQFLESLVVACQTAL